MPRLPLETELIGAQSLQYMIELSLWSAYVKDARQVPLLILAKPESAKTEAPAKYVGNRGVIPIRRFTHRGIIDMLKDGTINPKEPVIFVIPDLDAVMKQKPEVVDRTVLFLDAVLWEGLDPEATWLIGYKELEKFRGFKAGLIAGITDEGFFTKYKNVKANLLKGGFLSRCIVFSIDYSASQVSQILDEIFSGAHSRKFVEHIDLHFPRRKYDVYLPKRFRNDLKALTMDIAEEIGTRGFRIGQHLMTLAKASVLRDGRFDSARVTDDDYDLVHHLSRWMNFEQNVLKDYSFNRVKTRTFFTLSKDVGKNVRTLRPTNIPIEDLRKRLGPRKNIR